MKHKVGLYIGRFQPFHKGHLSVVREALNHCEKLIIVVGSAQEFGTKKNPFTFELRKEFILRGLRGLGKDVCIIPINDRPEVENDCGWGEYVMKEIFVHTGYIPTVNFEGHEAVRAHWFDTVDIERVELSRDVLPFSATILRKAIVEDDYYAFTNMMPTALWIKYSLMRMILLEVENETI